MIRKGTYLSDLEGNTVFCVKDIIYNADKHKTYFDCNVIYWPEYPERKNERISYYDFINNFIAYD